MQDAWKATDATACKNNRLFLNGTDFSTPHPELSSVLRDLNESNPDTVYVNGRLEDYAAALHASLDPATLKTIKGELRDGPAGECSGNALSSRIYLKMLNKKAQNLLLHKAEPLCAAAEMSGTPLPKSFTDRGWKYLLQAHPHDSINGVTQDKTANDVEYRLAQAIEIGEVAADKAVHTILDQIDFSGYEGADSILVVVNPLPFPVQDVLKVCVAVPRSEGIWSFCAYDANGAPLQTQEIARDEKAYPVHDREARPWPFLADRHFLYIETGVVPATGYQVISLKKERTFNRNYYYWLPARENAGKDICRCDNILENEFLKAEVQPNGTICLTEKETGRVYNGLHYFEDTGDVGNYWAYAAPYHNRTYTTLTGSAQCWCEDNGPLSATLAVRYSMELPEKGFEAKCGVHGEGKRSEDTKSFFVTSRFTLKKGEKQLNVRTELTNNICNHRLRVAFPTGIGAKTADAAGHFTVDSRPATPVKNANGTYWPEMQTLPMQSFVDVSNGENGLALLNNCLTEYELRDDEKSTLYLTLFRAMGNMIVTWSEAVGEFDDQTGSQLLRNMVYEYALYPHTGNWESGTVYKQAQRFNVTPSAYQVCGGTAGTLPTQKSFLSIDNDHLIQSAFKKAEDRNTYILRVFNPTAQTQCGTVRLGEAIQNAWLCNLNEERQSALPTHAESFVLEAAQNKIVTVEIELKPERPAL